MSISKSPIECISISPVNVNNTPSDETIPKSELDDTDNTSELRIKLMHFLVSQE